MIFCCVMNCCEVNPKVRQKFNIAFFLLVKEIHKNKVALMCLNKEHIFKQSLKHKNSQS